jgi:DNA-binding MarR family transcriptional regulator
MRRDRARLIRALQIYMEKRMLKLAPFMSPRSAESTDLMRLIAGVNRRLEQAMEAQLKPNGMAIEQYRVLEALERRDGQPMGDLAAQVFVDSPTLTKIIDRMVAAAEVYRAPDPGDRRRVLIFRASKGIDSYKRLSRLLEMTRSDIIGNLEQDEAKELRSLLTRLMDRQ